MINNAEALSMPEAAEYIDKDSRGEVLTFIKKFTKLKPKEAQDIRRKIISLDLMKIDEKSISKIIDILPENEEELNKIFWGMSLDEEESKKILDIIKEFK
ncbi:MAG: hypothetical protein AABW50_05725 [Nanoarchaeota archaeon]